MSTTTELLLLLVVAGAVLSLSLVPPPWPLSGFGHEHQKRKAFDRKAQRAKQRGPSLQVSKDSSASIENPPMFPRTTDEFAADAAYFTKVALVSRINRIRIDYQSQTLYTCQKQAEWLIEYTKNMIDEDIRNIRVFIQDDLGTLESFRILLEKLRVERDAEIKNFRANNEDSAAQEAEAEGQFAMKQAKSEGEAYNIYDHIKISPLTDTELEKSDDLYFIFEPCNMIPHMEDIVGNADTVLQDVQALAFHAALRKVPIVLCNPQLIAVAWDDFTRRPSLLGR
jgi:hypothetical protein